MKFKLLTILIIHMFLYRVLLHKKIIYTYTKYIKNINNRNRSIYLSSL